MSALQRKKGEYMRLFFYYGIGLVLSMSNISALVEENSNFDTEELRRCGHCRHHHRPEQSFIIEEELAAPDTEFIPIDLETNGIVFDFGDTNQGILINGNRNVTTIEARSRGDYDVLLVLQLQNNSGSPKDVRLDIVFVGVPGTIQAVFTGNDVPADGIIYNRFYKGRLLGPLPPGNAPNAVLKIVPRPVSGVNIKGILFSLNKRP